MNATKKKTARKKAVPLGGYTRLGAAGKVDMAVQCNRAPVDARMSDAIDLLRLDGWPYEQSDAEILSDMEQWCADHHADAMGIKKGTSYQIERDEKLGALVSILARLIHDSSEHDDQTMSVPRARFDQMVKALRATGAWQ